MLNSDPQLEYWDRVGPTKRFSHPVNFDRLTGLVMPHGRILDVGCGYGRTLQELGDRGYDNLLGVDPAPTMVAAARARVPSASVQEMEPPWLPVPDGSVDAVLMFSLLTCIPGDDDQRAAIGEAERVLRPTGLLYISDLWLQDDERNRARYDRYADTYARYGVFELPEGVVLRHHEREWIDELTSSFHRLALDDRRVRTMNGHDADAFQWFGCKRTTPRTP